MEITFEDVVMRTVMVLIVRKRFELNRSFQNLTLLIFQNKYGKYDDAICTILNNCVGKVSDAALATDLAHFREMNFVEKLQLWVKLFYYKSNLKKNCITLNIRLSIDNPSSGIVEDHMWALERVTHMCPHHVEIKRKFAANEKVTIRDTCLGSTNCKWGAHHEEQLINIADLLTGNSDAKIYERNVRSRTS